MGIREFSLTGTQPCEIETQDPEAFTCQGPTDITNGRNVLPTGETMGEEDEFRGSALGWEFQFGRKFQPFAIGEGQVAYSHRAKLSLVQSQP